MRLTRGAITFITVAFLSGIIGVGTGFVQALILSQDWPRLDQAAFSATVGLAAGISGPLFGIVMYYAILKRDITFETFCAIVTLSVCAGWGIAWLLSTISSIHSWFSGAVTPVVAFLMIVTIRIRRSTCQSNVV